VCNYHVIQGSVSLASSLQAHRSADKCFAHWLYSDGMVQAVTFGYLIYWLVLVFCLPWGRPCGNHAKRCMNEKTIHACQTPRRMYPSIFNSFPVIRTTRAKNRRFHVPQFTFLFPLETLLRLSRNVLHGWKDNSVLAKRLAACTYLSYSFRVIRWLSQCIIPKIAIFTTFLFPLGMPLEQSR